MTAILFSILCCGSLGFAQPWQWELVSPEWQNPSGFPLLSPTEFPVCVADVNGDGLADILQFGAQIYTSIQTEDGAWIEQDVIGGPELPSQYLVTGQELDGDAAQELVFCPLDSGDVRFYELDMNNGPWQWVERPDLWRGLTGQITGLRSIIWGRFLFQPWWIDEAAVLTQSEDSVGALSLYYRSQPGDVWGLQYTYTFADVWPRHMYSGDFDHDGDSDIAVEVDGIDDFVGTIFFEDTGSAFIVHELDSDMIGPGGGDFDGDGEWEFLYVNVCSVPPMINLDGPFIMSSANLLDFNIEQDLRTYGRVIGGWRNGDEFIPFGLNSFFCSSPWSSSDTRTDLRDLRNPNEIIESHFDFAFESFSMGDADGNGWKDLLGAYWVDHGAGWQELRWKLLINIGDAGVDDFDFSDANFVDANHDYASEFGLPYLGDVNGDGRAELLLKPNASTTIQVFQLEQITPSVTITRDLPLEAGFPSGASAFDVADLDGDGIVEILPIVNGTRYVYFFRNGAWESYDNILPEITGQILGFADWNNDGTTDIFTDEGVYLNLTPSAFDNPTPLLPLSLSLSAYPNPFNAQTTLEFTLPQAGHVELRLFDLLGRNVRTLLSEPRGAGTHRLNFDAAELPSGVYFARLDAAGLVTAEKLLLLK